MLVWRLAVNTYWYHLDDDDDDDGVENNNTAFQDVSLEFQAHDFVRVVNDVFPSCQQQRFDVAGFSLGGRVALAVASTYPHMIRKLHLTGFSAARDAYASIAFAAWEDMLSIRTSSSSSGAQQPPPQQSNNTNNNNKDNHTIVPPSPNNNNNNHHNTDGLVAFAYHRTNNNNNITNNCILIFIIL